MSDDGFVVIESGGRGRIPLAGAVAFSPTNARFPGALTAALPQRMTWAWDGNGTLRARFSENGALGSYGNKKWRTRAVSAVRLYTAIGRTLHGRYPISRIDGHDIYIDISEVS